MQNAFFRDKTIAFTGSRLYKTSIFFPREFSVQAAPELLIDKFLLYGHYFLIACLKIVWFYQCAEVIEIYMIRLRTASRSMYVSHKFILDKP